MVYNPPAPTWNLGPFTSNILDIDIIQIGIIEYHIETYWCKIYLYYYIRKESLSTTTRTFDMNTPHTLKYIDNLCYQKEVKPNNKATKNTT